MSVRWRAGLLAVVLLAFVAAVALLVTAALGAAWGREPPRPQGSSG